MGESARAGLERHLEGTEAEALIADGFDEAIVGVAYLPHSGVYVVVYDRDKAIEILARDMGLADAIDYFSFNTEGSYMGEGTPIWMTPLSDSDSDSDSETH